jgi:hypothetical protein
MAATMDARATTEAERRSLGALREITGADSPLERHGHRCLIFAERLAERRGLEVDGELLMCAALLHDIGLYPGASRGGVYTSDGALFAADLLSDDPGWPGERLEVLKQTIDRHHELRPQWSRGNEVELLRLADRIEVSNGLITSGLGHGEVRAVFAEVPRTGFYREVGRLLGHALRERPATLPRILRR